MLMTCVSLPIYYCAMKGNTDNQLCAEVNERGCYLLETAQYLDCKFLVGVEPHQEEIASHKLILAMASRVFEAMFYGDLSEKNNPIDITDIQPETFNLLLQYIYTGSFSIKSVDEACNLYYASKKYMLQHLLEECSQYLWDHVDTDNVCQLFEFAQFYEDKKLLLKCERIFCTETKEVLNNSKFEEAQLDTVIRLFSQDTLNIDCETALIEAAARYVKAQNIRFTGRGADQSPSNGSLSEMSEYSDRKDGVNGVNAENSPDPVVEAQKVGDGDKQSEYGSLAPEPALNTLIKENSKISRIVEKIRFPCLTAEQFAECSERTSILTLSEENAVLLNLVSRKCNVALPRGFSTWHKGRRHIYKETPSKEGDLTGSFVFTVYGFTYLNNILSPPCYVRGLPWQLNVTKNEKGCRRVSIRCSGLNSSRAHAVTILLDVYGYGNYEFALNVGDLLWRDSIAYFFLEDDVDWDSCIKEDGSVEFEVIITEDINM